MKRSVIGIIALILVLAMLMPLLVGCKKETETEKPASLLSLLPMPEKEFTVLENTSERVNISVPEVSQEEYESYRQACIDAGFTENVEELPIAYYADDQDGYQLSITISKSILYITLKTPEK